MKAAHSLYKLYTKSSDSKEKVMRLWKEIKIEFFFDENLRNWSKVQLTSLKLLLRDKHYYKIDVKNLLRDNVLRL